MTNKEEALEIIKKFKVQIHENKFTEFYNNLSKLNLPMVGTITQIFIDAEIIDDILDNLKIIPKGCFYETTNISKIKIPDTVTNIDDYAFFNCPSLTNVTIGDNVESIGYRAFCLCSGLGSITLPDSVTRIGPEAFYRCKGLSQIIIPDSVQNIGKDAFIDCHGLMDVTIPSRFKLKLEKIFGGINCSRINFTFI